MSTFSHTAYLLLKILHIEKRKSMSITTDSHWVNHTSSDFCRKSLDCRRNVWAWSISLSNKLISSWSTGQPCFSKSSIMDGLLSRNDGTLSSPYLGIGQKIKQKGSHAMPSLSYRNYIETNNVTSHWLPLYLGVLINLDIILKLTQLNV